MRSTDSSSAATSQTEAISAQGTENPFCETETAIRQIRDTRKRTPLNAAPSVAIASGAAEKEGQA